MIVPIIVFLLLLAAIWLFAPFIFKDLAKKSSFCRKISEEPKDCRKFLCAIYFFLILVITGAVFYSKGCHSTLKPSCMDEIMELPRWSVTDHTLKTRMCSRCGEYETISEGFERKCIRWDQAFRCYDSFAVGDYGRGQCAILAASENPSSRDAARTVKLLFPIGSWRRVHVQEDGTCHLQPDLVASKEQESIIGVVLLSLAGLDFCCLCCFVIVTLFSK